MLKQSEISALYLHLIAGISFIINNLVLSRPVYDINCTVRRILIMVTGYMHKDSTSHVISDSLMVMHLTKRYRKDEESVLPRRRSIQILVDYKLPQSTRIIVSAVTEEAHANQPLLIISVLHGNIEYMEK